MKRERDVGKHQFFHLLVTDRYHLQDKVSILGSGLDDRADPRFPELHFEDLGPVLPLISVRYRRGIVVQPSFLYASERGPGILNTIVFACLLVLETKIPAVTINDVFDVSVFNFNDH